MGTRTTYDELLTRSRALIAASDRIPVIGISGHGGSGKSTLAGRLGDDLGLDRDQVVPTDCFYATTCGPRAGMWEQHDWRLIEELVRTARSIPAPDRLCFEYRWWTGQTGVEDHPMPPVLIVEGIRLIHDRTRGWFDLTVWIDLDPEAAGARAKARNLLQGDDQAELDLWDTKWIPEGHAYAAEVDPARSADLVLPPTMTQIRLARPEDLDAILEVGRETWEATYVPLAGEAYVNKVFAMWWTREATLAAIVDRRVCVADADGLVVGMTMYGVEDRTVDIWKLYVRPDWQGQGIGTSLLTAVLNATGDATDRAVLAYMEGNDEARAFYDRMGFEETHREADDLGGPDNVWMVMRRPQAAE